MIADSVTPRGIRNNNPLNIKLNSANKWQGRVPPAENTDGVFEQYLDEVWGLRAPVVLIISHFDRRSADTIAKLVWVWAPAPENDPGAYARFVADRTGLDVDEPLDFHRWEHVRPVLLAMGHFENGVPLPYTDAQIDAALVRAGVLPPAKPLAKSRTVRGGQVATGGTVGAGGIEAVQDALGPAQEALGGLAAYLDIAKYALIAVVLLGVGLMVYARWDDRRKGLR